MILNVIPISLRPVGLCVVYCTNFIYVVLCAVVLAASWLALPLCSPIFISSLMMDSDVECDATLPSLAVVWKRLEGSCR